MRIEQARHSEIREEPNGTNDRSRRAKQPRSSCRRRGHGSTRPSKLAKDVAHRHRVRVRGPARARALEAQGKNIVHLEIGQPDFPTPAAHQRRGEEGAGRRLDRLRADAGVPGFPRGHRRVHLAHPRHQRHRQERRRRPRRQADHVLHDDGRARARRRGDLSEPRLPDLRVDDQLPRRDAGADAAGREPRLLVRPRHLRAEAVAADEDGRAQLAGQSDRRR